MSLADAPAPGPEPVPLAPPAALTCPRCGGGLPANDLPACPSCGNALGSALFGGPPPPLPEQPTGFPREATDDPAPAVTRGRDGDRRSMPVIGADPALLRPLPPASSSPEQDQGQCRECDGPYDADGYCTQCGARRPARRDHLTATPAPWLAGVCDRGIRHAENQDAMALRADPNHAGRAALVVCDGVTTAMRSAEASLSAAEAAAAVLASSRAQGLGVASAREAALTARLETAADAAIDAVREVTSTVTRERADADRSGRHGHALDAESGASLPACTFVAAVVEEDLVVVGSVGDSRAYWLPDPPDTEPDPPDTVADSLAGTGSEPAPEHVPLLLTEDDSFAQEQIRAGMDRAAAESGPHAHTITRWLGSDAPDHTPASRSLVPAGPGWLLLCSDGLWNYASEPADLAAVVRQVAAERTVRPPSGARALDRPWSTVEPLALAQGLIRWANAQGGHDNITAVVARLGLPRQPTEPPEAHEAGGADTSADASPEVPQDLPTVAIRRPEHEDADHG